MVFGLPATSLPSQVGFEQPRTVMVPVVVPGFVGANGVMLITPVVVPVIWKLWLNWPAPDWLVSTKTEPLSTVIVTL